MHHFLLFARKRKSYAISEFELFKVPLYNKNRLLKYHPAFLFLLFPVNQLPD